MTKKKGKRTKRTLKNHEKHHAAIHNWIMHKRIADGEIDGVMVLPEHHVMPEYQPWHVPATHCACRPKKLTENALTGSTVWQHNGWIN